MQPFETVSGKGVRTMKIADVECTVLLPGLGIELNDRGRRQVFRGHATSCQPAGSLMIAAGVA